MMCDDSIKQESKRFYLGDDSDESEAEDEPNQRRYSISSGCSDDVVGGVPTNLNFDEDSGLGMSLDDDSNDSNDSQLLPLRPVNIGKCASSKLEHKQQRTRRGKKFYDFYEIKGHLGSGAYATVETCVSRTTGEEFAVKLVKKHEQGHTRSRILREVEVFKMCRNHPNIVQLQEWFEDEDYYYMVFEKMEGGPLLSQIQNKVCFNEQEAAQVTKNIANALKFLHSKHIAHRDLKPENVLCCSNSSVAPVKLCDLDLASKPSIHGIRRTSRQLQNVQSEPDLSSPVGSAEFLAPEVVETFVGEALKYNRQCDMWSLGIIIFVMLSGYTPFYGECENADNCGWNQGQFCEDCQENLFEKIRQGSFEFPPEEWDNISAEAKDLISHLLVKDARKRYTAVEVLNHPWIINAPETPLNTATNLCRNSSTKEIQQYNDQFNAMNHFVNRLSSRVEETIPSCGTSPENECALQDVYETSPQYAQEVVTETAKVLEKSGAEEKPPMINKQPEHMPIYTGHHEMQQHMFYYPPPPMVNMTGVFYGPPMVSNDHFGYIPQQHYYSQHQPYYITNDYTAQYVNAPNYNHQGYVPVPFYNPATKLETVVEETPRVNQMGRVNSALAQRPLTPATDPLDASEMKKLQQHRGSLSAAISQLGLENCQNAMIRQGSASKEIYRGTREAEVNV